LGFDYLIVQIVDWSNGKPQPVTSWLLLSPANTRRPWKGFADKPTTGNRIYGSKTIGFVILHRGIPKPNAADIRYSITVKRKDSVQLTDLKSLLGILSKAVAAGPQETVLAIAGTVENIKALPDDVAFSGTAYLDTAKKTAGAGPDSTFSQTYDDEGYAGWDISASIPLNGISEVQYSSTDDTLQPKTVTRANSYALAHWYPYPVDLKSGYPSWPSLVGGLAIAGKPLNKPFAGVAVGTHKPFPLRVNVFAGAVFNKVFSPAPTPTEPTHLSSHRVTKLMYGIDIPISQLVSALSKSSSN
jgi:hypothetical protein